MDRKSNFANGFKKMERFTQYTKVLLVAAVISSALLVYDRKDVLPMDLAQFQWENRLLFLFAPDESNPYFKRLQSEITKQPYEVEDRDLVIFEILEQGPSRMNTTPLDRQTANSIRDHFEVPQRLFTLILVGKDGGVKLKRNDQVNLTDVFGLIDSMPMRQNEMQQKNK
jgi:hypothetical protein